MGFDANIEALIVKIKLKQRLFRHETTFIVIHGGINAIFVYYLQIIIADRAG